MLKTIIREAKPFVMLALVFAFMVTFKHEKTLTDEEIATIESQQLKLTEQISQKAEIEKRDESTTSYNFNK